jgi:hypothetical protein
MMKYCPNAYGRPLYYNIILLLKPDFKHSTHVTHLFPEYVFIGSMHAKI